MTRAQMLRSLALLLLAILGSALASETSKTSTSSSTNYSTHSVSEMNATDVFGLVLMTIALTIASAGGIGGGSFLVPAFVLIMRFDIKRATPISSFAVLGCAVANNWFNLNKRHPHAGVDRPLIDSDLVAVIVPVVMGGAIIGAILTNLLPSYLIALMFTVVLTATGTRTVQKARGLRRRERRLEKEQPQDVPTETTSDPPATPAVETAEETSPKTSSYQQLDDAPSDELAQIIEAERHYSVPRHVGNVICYLGLVAATIVGKLVTCGGVVYWLVLVVEIPWVAAFTMWTTRSLHRVHERKLALGYKFAEGDMQWTGGMAIKFPLGCAAAGVIAGLFGVGGAIVVVPLLLELGVIPEVVSACAAVLLFFSAAAALSKYILLNMVTWDWALMMFVIATIVTAFAQVVIVRYVRRTGRQSVIVLCIGISILLGGALMAYRSVDLTVRTAGDAFHPGVCK